MIRGKNVCLLLQTAKSDHDIPGAVEKSFSSPCIEKLSQLCLSLSLPRNSSQLCCWDVSTSGSSHTGLCIPREPASTNQKPAFANVIGLGQSGGRISG